MTAVKMAAVVVVVLGLDGIGVISNQ
jgi:hypothetical protein